MRRSDRIRGDARKRGRGADRHAGFTVSDGRFTSRTATVTIDVAANDAPTASDATISAPFAGSVPVDLVAADPDGAALIWRIGTPAHGTLTGTAPRLTYTPDAGYVGADSFTFTVSDGRFTSRTATITIDVPQPTLTLAGMASGRVTAGDQITITGTGMPPLTPVTVELHSTPVVLGTVPVGVNGSFTLTVTVPTLTAAGVHTVRAFVGTVEAARATLTVDAAAAPVPPVTRATVLSATGGQVPVDLVAMASLLLMAGLLLVIRRRRRQA